MIGTMAARRHSASFLTTPADQEARTDAVRNDGTEPQRNEPPETSRSVNTTMGAYATGIIVPSVITSRTMLE